VDIKDTGWEGMELRYLAPVASSCENGNELSHAINEEEFLYYLINDQLLKNDSAL
jgi:hypothetical protein